MDRPIFIKKNTYSYEKLKEEIITGVYSPGDKLSVNTLSKKYYVSTMPIRDALAKLELEGFIRSAPNKGAWVQKWDYKKFYELTQVALALESMASRLAAHFVTKDDLSVLWDLIRQMDDVVKNDDVSAYQSINDRFHFSIFSFSGNEELSSLAQATQSQIYPYTAVAIRSEWRLYSSMKQHHALFSALKNKNAEAAATISKQHRLETYDLFLNFLENCLKNKDDARMRYYLYGFSDTFKKMSDNEIRSYLRKSRSSIYSF